MEILQTKTIYTAVTLLAAGGLGHWITTSLLNRLKLTSGTTAARHSHFSKWIGITERCTIALLVMSGSIGSTVFIFATKTAIMTHRLDVDNAQEKRRLTEYMLVGTMISYLLGLIFGLIGKAALIQALG